MARSQQRGNLAQYEYYPEEIEKLDEEETLVILREVFEEKEEKPEEMELEALTAAGMVLPEDFQVNLFEFGNGVSLNAAAETEAEYETEDETETEAAEETEEASEEETAAEE